MTVEALKKVLVVEDDIWQRTNIRKAIEEVDETIFVYTAGSYLEAMSIAKCELIDLFFFDIKLGDGGDGFELAQTIRKEEKYALTWMAFLTTDTTLELEAYKTVHCYEYIAKPYKKEKIQSLVRHLLISHDDHTTKINQPFIVLEIDQSNMKIFIDDIVFVEAKGRGAEINTTRDEYLSSYTSLKQIAMLLESYPQFVKTHRSFIVNIKYVKCVKRLSSRQSEIVFINGKRHVSLSYKNRKRVEEKLLQQ